MPDQRIIDSHLHLWDLDRNYYPWLCDENAPPHRYGSQQPLRRNYLPADYRADSAHHDVAATVHAEAMFDPRNPIEETRWLGALRRETGMPTVAVASAELEHHDIERTLAAHAAAGFVRGIRHRIRLVPSPGGTPAAARVAFDDPGFLRGFALLRAFGFSCDIVAPSHYLHDIAALARNFPDTTIIVNHCGHPANRTPAGLATWRDGMEDAARCPNVAVKVSGVGVGGRPWTAELNAPIIRDTMRIFGSDRCLFASNFPPDSLVTTFDAIVALTDLVASEFPDDARDAVFYRNAKRIYRIGSSE